MISLTVILLLLSRNKKLSDEYDDLLVESQELSTEVLKLHREMNDAIEDNIKLFTMAEKKIIKLRVKLKALREQVKPYDVIPFKKSNILYEVIQELD